MLPELLPMYSFQQFVQNLCPHSNAKKSDMLTSSPQIRHSSVAEASFKCSCDEHGVDLFGCVSWRHISSISPITKRFLSGWSAEYFASAIIRLRNALSIVLDSILSKISSGVLYKWKSIDTTLGYGTKYGHFSASSAHLSSKQSLSFCESERWSVARFKKRYSVARFKFSGLTKAPKVAS